GPDGGLCPTRQRRALGVLRPGGRHRDRRLQSSAGGVPGNMGRFRRNQVEDPDEGRERFNFTRDIIEDISADRYRPASLAVDGEGVIDRRTFRELAEGAARWSALLRTYGLEPGDCVLVHLGNSPPWPAVLLGALKAGIVAVSCPETASPDEL